MNPPKRITPLLLIIMLCLPAIAIAGSIWQTLSTPSIPLVLDSTMTVWYRPIGSSFQRGDELLAFDGYESFYDIPATQRESGDQTVVTLVRDGEMAEIVETITSRTPIGIKLLSSAQMLVAVGFWLVGCWVFVFRSSLNDRATVFIVWSAILSLFLTLLQVNFEGNFALSLLVASLLSVVSLHLHLIFPTRLFMPTRRQLFVAYGLAVSIAAARFAAYVYAPTGWQSLLTTRIIFYWTLAAVAGVIICLWVGFQRADTAGVRRQVGFITLSGIIGIAPLLLFYLLPSLLLGRELLPLSLSIIFFGVVPLGYGYSILRHRVIVLEQYVNRAVSSLLVLLLIVAIVVLIEEGLRELFSAEFVTSTFIQTLIVVPLVLILNPLYRLIRNGIDRLLYGGWYDSFSVVSQMSDVASEALDIQTVAHSLSVNLQRSMRVYWVVLMLEDEDGQIRPISTNEGSPAANIVLASNSRLLAKIHANTQATRQRELENAAGVSTWTTEEQQLLRLPNAQIWLPFSGLNQRRGLIILGPKFGTPFFSAVDLDTLSVAARQVSIIMQNIQLLKELELRVAETLVYRQRITTTRDDERKHIAYDLHDDVIQELVGIRYALAHANSIKSPTERTTSLDEIEQTVTTLIKTTRQLCQRLRPPSLDLGLAPGLRSLAHNLEAQSDVRCYVKLDPLDNLSEDIMLCLYRCVQESLQNTLKHGEATTVRITLRHEEDGIYLTVKDDGIGFVVPERLASLMQAEHFGIVGIRERIELRGGTFQLESQPKAGTMYTIHFPSSVIAVQRIESAELTPTARLLNSLIFQDVE